MDPHLALEVYAAVDRDAWRAAARHLHPTMRHAALAVDGSHRTAEIGCAVAVSMATSKPLIVAMRPTMDPRTERVRTGEVAGYAASVARQWGWHTFAQGGPPAGIPSGWLSLRFEARGQVHA